MLDGADISWIVGLILTSVVYYVCQKRFAPIPAPKALP
jgi:NCS1 family nucleobase:cation symporter-1